MLLVTGFKRDSLSFELFGEVCVHLFPSNAHGTPGYEVVSIRVAATCPSAKRTLLP